MAISMISMHSFVSHRTLQIRTTIDGLKQSEAALEGLLKIHERFISNRPHVQSSRYELSINGMKTEIFVEERISEQKRWIGGEKPGRYHMLDSLHYLSQVCENKNCWVTAAEEVFSPEPLASYPSYDSYDVGFPSTPIKPVRSFSHLTRLEPGEWKTILSHQCLDLKDRSCRLKLLEKLRSRNHIARQRQYSEATITKYLQKKVPYWPKRLEETDLIERLKLMESDEIYDLPDLNWMVGTYYSLMDFKAPERVSVEEISIRGPENISEPSDEEKVILKRWFNIESIKTPEIRFRDTYFHNDTHPLSHLSINQKWDAALFTNHQKFPEKMDLNRGLSIYALRYRARCSTLPVNTPKDFLRLQRDYDSIRRYFQLEDCNLEPGLEVQILTNGEKTAESARIFVENKQWISLKSLWNLYSKLGGIQQGKFPDQPLEKPKSIKTSIGKEEIHGIIIIPIYQ